MIVTALPANMCEPELSEAAQFCINVAASSAELTQIWVLGGTHNSEAKLKLKYPNLEIRNFQLDSQVWAQNVGSNAMLEQPMTLHQAFHDHGSAQKVNTIYIPLNGASGYFLQMAAQSKTLPYDVKIITTCYLPKTFSAPAQLLLPTELSDVVTGEMEVIVAQNSSELWISSPLVKESIMKKLSIDGKNIRILESQISHVPPEITAKLPTRHIIFYGPLSPIYGIDIFCELAENMDSKSKLDTITIISPAHESIWLKSTQQRLSKLKAEVIWRPPAQALENEFSNGYSEIEAGVLICPMRAPLLPQGVKLALNRGLPCIWGQGFDLRIPKNAQSGLYCTVSDIRKIQLTLETLGNVDTLKPSPLAPKVQPIISDTAVPQPISQVAKSKIDSLSVIVLHHDRPNKLHQALKSLSKQTLTDFEVVLVDDGSAQVPTKTLQATLDYFDFQNARLCQIENSYPSAARNHGVFNATGSALFFLDDDNILDPRTLEVFLGALQNHDLVQSFYQTFAGITAPVLTRSKSLRPNQIGLVYGFAGLLPGAGLFFNIIGNSSFMIRRDCFLNLGGFTPKYGVGFEDYALMLKASQRQDLDWVILPEPYLHFRIHDKKIRNTHVDWRSPTRFQASQWRLFEDLQNEPLSLSPISLAYARQLHELTQYAYVHSPRPKYFRLKSVLRHQYIQPILRQNKSLRKVVEGSNSRFAKWLERIIAK